MAAVEEALAEIHRSDWGRLLSMLVARSRRLDLAEDALADAFARANERWPGDGLPSNPSGWLYTTAWRGVLGSLRAEAMRGRKAPLLAVDESWSAADDAGDEIDDERLAVILLACHPALDPAARAALALRLVIGTPTDEIARLFLVKPATMAARITRAKRKIVAAGIPLSRPADTELAARLDDVCRTVYLAFTAGYTPGDGPDLLRADLAGEAVELAAVLRRLVPSAPQVRALHGLLLLQHSRRDARAADGALVTLPAQDRARWRHEEIAVGVTLVDSLPETSGYGEELRLQAVIAAVHAQAPTPAETDWWRIAQAYERLELLTGSPVVRLNRAVAVAEVDGARAGLSLLDGLESALGTNHRFHAVRGDLADRAGDPSQARAALERALELCRNDVERRHLVDRIAQLS